MGKLLFLGGSYGQLPGIEYAKKRGHEVILVDYLPNNPGQKIASKFYNVSTTDIEAVIDIAHNEKIDGVTAFASDPAAYTAAVISEKMGLIGNPSNAVKILSNKYHFRLFLKENNFPVPLFISENTLDKILSFYRKYKGRKFILKPNDASGSKGVYIINNEKELLENFSAAISFSKSGNVILEEFIHKKGPQIHGEGFVINGELKFILLGDQYFDKKTGLVPYSTIIPSIEHQNIIIKAYDQIQKIVQKVGFLYGGLNIEIIPTEKDLMVLEIGPRTGGNYMFELIRQATGVDLIAANIDVLFHPNSINFDFNKPKDYYAQIILHSYKAGILKKINMSYPFDNVLFKKYYYEPGSIINEYKNSSDVLGVMICKLSKHIIQNYSYPTLLYNHKFVELENETLQIKQVNKSANEILKYFIDNKDVFFSDLSQRVNLEDYAYKLFKYARQYWVMDRNKIIGFAAVYLNNSNYAYVSTISILNKYQGRGIGKELFRAIIQDVIKRKINRIRLEVEKGNTKALMFYKKLGFVQYKKQRDSYILELLL